MATDYKIPSYETSGSMTMQELLPNIDFSKYNMSEFSDVIPEFSTALLDFAQIQGAEEIRGITRNAQFKRQTQPNETQMAGATGFMSIGGGPRAKIADIGESTGLFSDIYESKLGTGKETFKILEGLKDKAFDTFYDIQKDLNPAEPGEYDDLPEYQQNNIRLYGDNPGARDSGLYGPQGSPGYFGQGRGDLRKGPDGQTYKWMGDSWVLHNIGGYSGQGVGDYPGFDPNNFGGGNNTGGNDGQGGYARGPGGV